MRVEIEMKNGRRTKVLPAIARHLASRQKATIIGEMPTEGTYQTRAMKSAARAADVPKSDPTVEEVPAETASVEAVPELDRTGQPWNPDLHLPEKIINANGTWRKKPGGRPAAESA